MYLFSFYQNIFIINFTKYLNNINLLDYNSIFIYKMQNIREESLKKIGAGRNVFNTDPNLERKKKAIDLTMQGI